MPSVFGLPPAAFRLHLAAESSAATVSKVSRRTPVSWRNASPFSSLTESNLIAAPFLAATNQTVVNRRLCKRSFEGSDRRLRSQRARITPYISCQAGAVIMNDAYEESAPIARNLLRKSEMQKKETKKNAEGCLTFPAR
jgi:hypothetical protein